MPDHGHIWIVTDSDWDDLPDDVTGCATCSECGKQVFVYRCPYCHGQAIDGDVCEGCEELYHG